MKKMKRIVRLHYILLFSILFSCNFLDRDPLHAVSDGSFWNNEQEARAFLDNIYNTLTPNSHVYLESASDNAYLQYPWEGGDLRFFTDGTHNAFTNFCGWWFSYLDIRNAHEFLEKIETVPNLSKEAEIEMRAEAHFFLALKYFEMWRAYKEVPLVDKVLSLEEADVPTSSEEEIITYIIDNVELAIEGLPEMRSDGRLNKYAAVMLKADLMMWIEDYQQVIELTKMVIQSGHFNLHSDYEELFKSEFQQGNKENILWREYKVGVAMHSVNLTLLPNGFGGGWSSVTPTQDLIDEYEAIDGIYPYTDSPLYNPEDEHGYTIRDPRFDATIMYHGSIYEGIPYSPLDLTDGNPNVIQGNNCTVTGYNFRKYTDLDVITPSSCDVNNYVYRYAETLLWLAEATNELQGPTSEVYDAINEVRTRAGLPQVDRAIYSDKESLRKLIQRERRVEFAGETKRMWDTWRWGENKIGTPENWMENTLQKDIESVVYEHQDGDVYPDFIRKRRTSDLGNKTYVFPIPQTALDVSNNITQHPAWR